MDLHYKQEVTVGALVIGGLLLFIGGTMWLSGRTFSGAPTVTMAFPEVETLKRGSPVRVSGVELGTVKDIQYERYGQVLVRASLDPRVSLKRDAAATLGSVGLVGDAVINLNPGTAPEPLAPDAVIPGKVEQGVLGSAPELSAQAKEMMAGVSEIANKQLAEDLSRTLAAVQRFADLYASPTRGPSADLTRTLEEVRRMGRRLDSTLTELQLTGRVATADTLMRTITELSSNVRGTTARLDTLMERVNRGEGTLGRLATDTLFYTRARDALRAFQEFVDDIRKHPGKIGINFRIF